MSNIFQNPSTWLCFAEEHNRNANTSATQLNGSDSYTLAAIHLAAGIPLPKSILLDTKRAHGKFVADHFVGLRQLYESGKESSRWLPDILKKCREFAELHDLDCDTIIQSLIAETEKRRITRPRTCMQSKTTGIEKLTVPIQSPLMSVENDSDDFTDVKI